MCFYVNKILDSEEDIDIDSIKDIISTNNKKALLLIASSHLIINETEIQESLYKSEYKAVRKALLNNEFFDAEFVAYEWGE